MPDYTIQKEKKCLAFCLIFFSESMKMCKFKYFRIIEKRLRKKRDSICSFIWYKYTIYVWYVRLRNKKEREVNHNNEIVSIDACNDDCMCILRYTKPTRTTHKHKTIAWNMFFIVFLSTSNPILFYISFEPCSLSNAHIHRHKLSLHNLQNTIIVTIIINENAQDSV